jgi:phosphopantothenoylcysteine decarboxylase/phosphopantothenate--cysteine ligase
VLIAPAMNVNMYTNPLYRENEEKLRRFGYLFVSPVSGSLACGWIGEGKLAAPETIFEEAIAALNTKDLSGRTIMVTAGPTREEIDPVRYISNHSSGKMGYALARAARRRGAQVTLISGPTCLLKPPGVEYVQVTSAVEMLGEVMARSSGCNVVIKAAAVADYRPQTRHQSKLKKTDSTILELKKNPDILAELGNLKHRPFLVGFAAETDMLEKYARMKLQRKNLDMIVANDVNHSDSGFNVDTNRAILFFRDGRSVEFALMSKDDLAGRILDNIASELPSSCI